MERVIDVYTKDGDFILPYAVGTVDKTLKLICEKCVTPIKQMYVNVQFPTRNNVYDNECFWMVMEQGSNQIDVDLVRGLDEISPFYQQKFLENMEDYKSARITLNTTGKEVLKLTPQTCTEDMYLGNTFTNGIFVFNMVTVSRNVKASTICKSCQQKVSDGLHFIINDNQFHLTCALKKANYFLGTVDSIKDFETMKSPDKTRIMEDVKQRVDKIKTTSSRKSRYASIVGCVDQKVVVFSSCFADVWKAEINGGCPLCSEPIQKGMLIFFYREHNTHVYCVLRNAFWIFDSPEDIYNWESLTEEHQNNLKVQYQNLLRTGSGTAMTFPGVSDNWRRREELTEIRRKRTAAGEHVKYLYNEKSTEPMDVEYAANSDIVSLNAFDTLYHEFRSLGIEKQKEMLLINNRNVPKTNESLLSELVDNALFGPPLPCPHCSSEVNYRPGRRLYACNGKFEFSKCIFTSKNPPRGIFNTKKILDQDKLSMHLFNSQKERVYLIPARPSVSVTRAFINPSEYVSIPHQISKRSMAVGNTTFRTVYVVKNGTAVPLTFENAESSHVMRDDMTGTLYDAFLTYVDITENRNTSIHLMILKDDFIDQYFVFKTISRLGTQLTKKCTNEFYDEQEAIDFFKKEFERETDNRWDERDKFVKKTGYYFYVDTWSSDIDDFESTTYSPIERQMLTEVEKDEFKLNLCKISSKNQYVGGRISKTLKEKICVLLKELQQKIKDRQATDMYIISTTNQVYSMLPTNCGFRIHKLLRLTYEIEDLLNVVESMSDVKVHKEPHPGVDLTLTPKVTEYLYHLDHDSKDWEFIEKYIENGQGPTHRVNVDLVDILKIRRSGYVQKEYPGQYMLLWHGTKKENLSKILDLGLRTHPDAQRTGSMFGYGIYFADCFSKSFNYARGFDDDIYMLLAEVAVGSIYHSFNAINETIIKDTLSTGRFDSVKGMGKWVPNPNDVGDLKGVCVPFGKQRKEENQNNHLIYNEYVVYDEARISLRYLVRIKSRREN